MYPKCTHETRNNSEQVIEESTLKLSFIMSTAPKSLIQLDYEKAALIYVGAQGTFKRVSF